MDRQERAQLRKRKRRRGLEQSSLRAYLILDTRIKDDIGLLSAGMLAELFPGLSVPTKAQDPSSSICYVAISPTTTFDSSQSDLAVPWTILAVRPQVPTGTEEDISKPSLRVSRTSTALPSFAMNFQKLSGSASQLHGKAHIDISILDVVPIGLKTVVVGIDGQALAKLEAANERHRKGRAVNGTAAGSINARLKAAQRLDAVGDAVVPDDHWEPAIKSAMMTPRIIHTGDCLNLHLPSHPITHVTPPPAVVHHCEPVSQGVITTETKVIVVSSSNDFRHLRPNPTPQALPIVNGTLAEEDENDTSNEQFYSAAEAPSKSPVLRGQPSASSDSTEDPATSNDDETDISDNEGRTLGLSLPSLPAQPSGTHSAFSSATPRVGNPFMDGIASPASAISGYSMSTIVGDSARGKLLEAHGLLSRVPSEVLHPKPADEEDEEARAFVDSALLAKLGCFSGDWVKIEATVEESLSNLGSWGIGALEGVSDQKLDWRTLKLYALPGPSVKRPRYALNRNGKHRHSQSLLTSDKTLPKIFLSPVVLANIGGPAKVRVAKLDLFAGRQTLRSGALATRLPPIPTAIDLTINAFATPIIYEQVFKTGMDWALEDYFKQKHRLVKSGDLIAITIGELVGRAISQPRGEDDVAQKELLANAFQPTRHDQDSMMKQNVIWYKVSEVHTDVDDVESPSGALAVVKSNVTTMNKRNDFRAKLPEATTSSWQYYLGTKQAPAMTDPSSNYELSSMRRRAYISPLRHRLRELMSAATSPQAIHHSMPPIAMLLTSTQRYTGKARMVQESCADLGLHCAIVDCHDIVSEQAGDKEVIAYFETRLERRLRPGIDYTCPLIQHIDAFNSEPMVASIRRFIEKSRIFAATTTRLDKLPDSMRSLFTHELEISAPDEAEREGILATVVQDQGLSLLPDVDLSAVALKTAALVAGDLTDVVNRAVVAREDRLEKLAADSSDRIDPGLMPATVKDILVAGGNTSRRIAKADFDVAVDAARKNFADAIGAPKIPNVSWEDVGGLSNVKDAVMETIQLPLERPELFAKGMKKRSGILFYGPPGTGKTLLAKAIATEFSLNFFSIKGPELLNMYIGESEANVRRVFQRARDARPCVVFFDELDSVAPKRGNQGDSGGVMDRIVSQLLAELDGMSGGDDGSGSGVFVIGATNRPDLLDQALLRPGRFDKMLYLGVSDTNEKQLTILEALTRKFALHPSLSLSSVAAALPLTYTGADLYALCSDAMLKAITRRADSVNQKVREINAKRASFVSRSSRSSSHASHNINVGALHQKANAVPVTVGHYFDHYATAEDVEVVVEKCDFLAAKEELIPSVSQKELDHYDHVRGLFESVDAASDGEQKPQSSGPPPRHLVFEAPEDPLNSDTGDHDDFVIRTRDINLKDVDCDGAGSKLKANGVVGKGKARAIPIRSDSTGFDFGFGGVEDSDEQTLYS